MLHHRHLVLGQGAGLIGADNLGTSQRLHRRQLPDYGVALGHIRDADGQNDGHHRCKPLRNGCHRKAHRHKEGVQHHFAVDTPRLQKAERIDKHTDPQHQPG